MSEVSNRSQTEPKVDSARGGAAPPIGMRLWFLFSFLLSTLEATVDIQINTGAMNTTFQGNTLRNGWFFSGISFAEDPVGNLHFEVRYIVIIESVCLH